MMEDSKEPTASGFGSFSMPSSMSKTNPFGTGSQAFGASSPSVSSQLSSAPNQNLFSQSTVPVFGSATSLASSGAGLFSTSQSQQNPVSSQNLFSQTTIPVFGSANSKASSNSSGLFSSSQHIQSSSQSVVPVFGSTFSANTQPSSSGAGLLFSTSQRSQVSSPQLFSSVKPSINSSVSTNAGFGKNTTNVLSSVAVTAISSGGSTLFGNKPTTSFSSSTLFGKSGTASSQSLPPALAPQPVFGSHGMKESSSKGLFQGTDTHHPSSSSNVSLETSLGATNTMFGGQSKTGSAVSTNSQSSVLFGKPKTSTFDSFDKSSGPSTLFGKSASISQATTTTTSSGLFGKPAISASVSSFSQSSDLPKDISTSVTSQKSTGLFGKPAPLFSGQIKGELNDDQHIGTSQDQDLDTTEPRKSLRGWKTSSSRKTAAMPLARRRSLLSSTSRGDVLSEDTAPSNSLVVRNIPPFYCEKNILRRHFSQFGKIALLRVTPEKFSAVLTYDSKDSALKAKEATILDSDSPPMDIFYRQSPQSAIKRSLSKAIKDTRQKNISQDAENELQSMAELPEFETETTGSKHAGIMSSFTRRSSPPPRRTSPPPRRPSPGPAARSATPTPQSSTSLPEGAPTDMASVKGLIKTLHQAKAVEASEKIAILDKRDQLLKLLRGRQQSDLASAKAFKGSCPDMCPEKERYDRQDTRRLALYEVILSTMSSVAGQKTKVDHAKAVKEYSRSSADQEEPLPHELRPLPVLKSTMVFLHTYVADEGGEGKWSEWYDFLWNRTRGIRKDITQQQLCHVDVAHLLEQVARFHIFCSERLCEEDMMTFDVKINNENLTKCLQTLKELYYDLETKHSCYCPNEAEIRAYIVLMNLNQGDTLREIQQLRPEIRESSAIRFAAQAYNALNSSNYVRFFRLIRKTTFLNGCILHRYFNQIRRKALLIIKKAMGTSGKSTPYPISEMIRLMCFENASEVIEFCSHYGLRVNNTAVFMDGASFIEPEGSLPQCRSIALVESKRTVPVGEIIYGGPLPPVDLPEPHSSFNAEGHFIFTPEFQQALNAAGLRIPAQVGEVLAKGMGVTYEDVASISEVHKPQPVKREPIKEAEREPDRMLYSNEAIKSAARTLILEETDGQVEGIVQEVLEDHEISKEDSIQVVSHEIIESAIDINIRSVAEDILEQEEEKLRHALKVETQKKKCIDNVSQELIEEVTAVIIDELTKNEMKGIEAERDRRLLDQFAQSNADNILQLVVRDQIDEVAAEVYEVDVVAKRERLADTEARIVYTKMRKCFQLWHRSYLKRLRVKRAMLDFPVVPPTRSRTQQLSALIPSRPSTRITGNSFYVGERAKLNVSSPMDTFYSNLHLSATLSMVSAQQMLSGHRMWQPLDITDTTARQLTNLLQEWKDCNVIEKNSKYMQWKLVLSTPIPKDDAAKDYVWWLRTKLGCNRSEHGGLGQKMETTAEGEIISNYTTRLPSQPLSLSFCVRSFHGNWKDTHTKAAATKNVLKGMNGLVFITSEADDFISSEACWKKDCQRLKDMLTTRAKNPAVPLVIIIPRLTPDLIVSSQQLEDHLDLNALHKKGLVSAVHFAQPYVGSNQAVVEIGGEWLTQLTNCLRFLASRIPSPPTLGMKGLEDFVEDGVVEFYKAPVYQDLRARTAQQLVHQSPNTLLSLYNDVIDHLGMVMASDTLTKCSWPAPEFDPHSIGLNSNWNSDEHLCDMYELMTKLRLPFFRYTDMEDSSWEMACQDVWKYIDTVTKKDSGSAKICLYQKVIDLLQATRKRFDQYCWLASADGNCEPTYVNMAWTDLIDACIHYKMVSLRTGHLQPPKEVDPEEQEPEDLGKFEELVVYYHQSELGDYDLPPVWEEALRDTETEASARIKETIGVKYSSNKRHRTESETEDMSMIGKRKRKNQEDSQKEKEFDKTITETADPQLKSLTDNFTEMLENEKEASERFEKYLESVVDNTHTSPQYIKNTAPHQTSRQDKSWDAFSDITPIGKRGSPKVESRPDLKRRKLSDVLLSHKKDDLENTNFNSKQNEVEVSKSIDKLVTGSYYNGDTASSITPISNDSDSLSDRLTRLRADIEEQKRQDVLYEMRLRGMIDG